MPINKEVKLASGTVGTCKKPLDTGYVIPPDHVRENGWNALCPWCLTAAFIVMELEARAIAEQASKSGSQLVN